jgi:hypothetical protein
MRGVHLVECHHKQYNKWYFPVRILPATPACQYLGKEISLRVCTCVHWIILFVCVCTVYCDTGDIRLSSVGMQL